MLLGTSPSNKELRLTKESIGKFVKSNDYCGPIRKKSDHYVSGMVEMAYNLFINEEMRDCYFVYEQAKLLDSCCLEYQR